MNIKMKKMIDILSQLSNGEIVDILGDDYYMSDSVIYRKDTSDRGVYINMSINEFINKCWIT